MHFIDNTSALTCCIGGSSSIDDTNMIIMLFSLNMANLRVICWAVRVESDTKLAYEPSHDEGGCPLAASLGALIVNVALPIGLNIWKTGLKELDEATAAVNGTRAYPPRQVTRGWGQ